MSLDKGKNDHKVKSVPKPVEPRQEDCCGNGCVPCIFDIYEQECKLWQKKCLKSESTECLQENEIQVPNAENYTFFKLTKLTKLTQNAYRYRFVPVNRDQKISIGIGCHLILRGYDGDDVITRQYTPIFSCLSYFEVMIKIYESGKMSSYLRTLKEEMEIEWRGPYGCFKYSRNKFRNIVMLAAGTGIAPMIRNIKSITDDEDDETFIRLLYTNTNFDEILLKNEIDDFKSFWNFTVLYVLTKEKDKSKKDYADELYYSHIDSGLLIEELKRNTGVNNTLFLICGSRLFENDMISLLNELGADKSNCIRF